MNYSTLTTGWDGSSLNLNSFILVPLPQHLIHLPPSEEIRSLVIDQGSPASEVIRVATLILQGNHY